MKIQVKLMGMLKDRLPPDGAIQLPDGDSTIENALAALGIPVGTVQVFSVNGSIERDLARQLQEGDELTVLPPVGGG
jgi:sulfur carrier protein ThiS